MESLLLCDEDWLRSSPTLHSPTQTHTQHKLEPCMDSFYTTREDCENALMVCLQKEAIYMPKPGYGRRLSQSSYLLHIRKSVVKFFIKCHHQLNLSLETIFHATNYFDRFVSMDFYDITRTGWLELFPVACLSIAAKFWEVEILQMADVGQSCNVRKVNQIELTVLYELEWRLSCVTPYSYMELLMRLLEPLPPQLRLAMTSRITELLLAALSDSKFTEFRPSAIAVSALRCSLEESLPSKAKAFLSNILNLIPQDQKDEINTCYKIMEEQVADPIHCSTVCGNSYFPSSPVTVMPIQQLNMSSYIDLSPLQASGSNVKIPSDSKKRNREVQLHQRN